MRNLLLLAAILVLGIAGLNSSLVAASVDESIGQEATFMDEFDPASPDAEAILEAYDRYYEEQTGKSARIDDGSAAMSTWNSGPTCRRESCPVWIRVNKVTQTVALYLDFSASPQAVWPVSTGAVGHTTPNFDTHPNGRIYDQYSSRKFPGGDYNGLGNMPYAIFIYKGYAIHGTPKNNWPLLGKRASHGCIRVHPDNAKIVNRLVRKHGIKNTWITVE